MRAVGVVGYFSAKSLRLLFRPKGRAGVLGRGMHPTGCIWRLFNVTAMPIRHLNIHIALTYQLSGKRLRLYNILNYYN